MTDTETWSKRVAEWRASGLKAEEFCSQRELAVSALYGWSSKLRRRGRVAAERPGRTIPMARVVPRAARTSSMGRSGESAVCIEVAGVRVTVAVGVDKGTLTSVLEVLESRVRGASR
jgi:hypothetical protein